MNEIIYLENDEEITSVIDRLRKAKEKGVALVIPRGGNLAQSIVNLKLLKKSAGELGKEISLVSNDRISRNLASQIGIAVFSKVSEAEKVQSIVKDEVSIADPDADFKVNSYYGKKGEEEAEDLPLDEETLEEGVGKEDIEDSYKEEEPPIKPSARDEEPEDEEDGEDDEPAESFQKRKAEKRNFDEPASHKLDDDVKKPMSRKKKIIIGMAAGVVVLLLAISYVFLPYAKAQVMVKTDDLNTTGTIMVNPDATVIDQENLIIPATTVEIEKEVTKTYPTTGKKDEGVKATGKITIYNEWDDKPKTIPADTKFISDDGKAFYSSSEVTVPKMVVTFAPFNKTPGTVDVLVTAENTGDSYNLGPSHFSIPSLTASTSGMVYGRSVSAMTGGATKTVNIVSDADFKTAEADLQKSIVELGKTELVAKAKEQKLEIIESKTISELLSKDASKNINDPADNFDYRVKMKLSVIAYSMDDLKTIMVAAAEKGLSGDKMLVGPDKFEVVATVSTAAATAVEPNAVKLTASLKGKTGQKISEIEIKNKIKNKKFAEARAIIENMDKVDSVDLQIWPSSIARVPLLNSRIKVTFDYAQ